ncbi:MAG: hypothetical protein AD742_08350 [Methylibium sp. NZG]|nr:MAG: hypothetical protein AD742_08350 [Methylibium sp. NZG]
MWELGSHAHCPVIGVCLPIHALRRLVTKAAGAQASADDYELHCGAITDCKRRGPIAEAVQRELDRRCALALRQTALAKTTEALRTWWCEASQGKDLAGALWATLTHARCTTALEHEVLGEVHMLQHQVGMGRRVDLERFEALVDQNSVLEHELRNAVQRCTRQADEHARRCDEQQGQLMEVRAQLIARDTACAQLREELQALHATVPGLKKRTELTSQAEWQATRIQDLERALNQMQQDAERHKRRADEQAAELLRRDAEAALAEREIAAASAIDTPGRLDDCAVLCVGGRPASVPLYRHIVERTGGRFLHHDGGEEESSGKLEATLAAADMVICQTGCISHNAYWRVKDHCKRTGKRCVFVESPSTAGLKRALVELQPAH